MLRKVYNYFFGSRPADIHGRPVYTHGPVMRRFTLGYCILALAIVAGLYLQHKQSDEIRAAAVQAAKAAEQSRKATCRQRQGFEIAAQNTEDFLNQGNHLAGVPDSILLRSIRLNRANADALRSVKCQYNPPIPGRLR